MEHKMPDDKTDIKNIETDNNVQSSSMPYLTELLKLYGENPKDKKKHENEKSQTSDSYSYSDDYFSLPGCICLCK